MTDLPLTSNVLGYIGLAVVAIAIIVLLVSTFHPEGRKRPGGYLDGKAPQPHDVPRDENGKPIR